MTEFLGHKTKPFNHGRHMYNYVYVYIYIHTYIPARSKVVKKSAAKSRWGFTLCLNVLLI